MGARVGQNSKYMHLIRAMRAGDEVYFLDNAKRTLERAMQNIASKHNCKLETSRHFAFKHGPETMHELLRVKMIQPIKES